MTPSNSDHVRHALSWLLYAQSRKRDGGIPKALHLLFGWLPSYPETSGYLICTLRAAEASHPDLPLGESALRIAEWLLTLQRDDGSFPDSTLRRPLVFDTGQILLGLADMHEQTGEPRFLDAATRAGDFLTACQSPDGSWVSHAFNDIPHAYYTRVAWGLMRLFDRTGDTVYRDRAQANVEWAIAQQRENGFLGHAGFTLKGHESPFTHTIAYALEGIARTGLHLDNTDYLGAAVRGLAPLVAATPAAGRVPGTFDSAWRGDESFSCLTGCAQLSLVSQLLAPKAPELPLRDFSARVNAYLRTKQRVGRGRRRVRGALAGSSPIWKDYHRLSYPNWAAKFLADALLMEDGCPAPNG